MAYFLRQEKKKKGTYLQMYDSYWDKEKKESRTKSVMAFGYAEELVSDELPDPIAYYKDFVATVIHFIRWFWRIFAGMRNCSARTLQRPHKG